MKKIGNKNEKEDELTSILNVIAENEAEDVENKNENDDVKNNFTSLRNENAVTTEDQILNSHQEIDELAKEEEHDTPNDKIAQRQVIQPEQQSATSVHNVTRSNDASDEHRYSKNSIRFGQIQEQPKNIDYIKKNKITFHDLESENFLIVDMPDDLDMK